MPLVALDAVVAQTADVADRFVSAGFRIFLVGGVVRDLLLDRPPSSDGDLDLTTDATPDQIKAILGPVAEALWLQGEQFGTVGATVGGRSYEITTHRSELYVADSRKPSVTFSTAIDEDLSRRDFTVNAMAIELPNAQLLDPHGGAEDLRSGRLRTPLQPEASFGDDPLRMLRAARFHAGYALEPTAEVVAAMSALRDRLDIVSRERVRDELDKLLVVSRPSVGLELLSAVGLLERFLPESVAALDAGRGAAVDALAPQALLRLAALLYPISDDAISMRLGELRYANERRSATAAIITAARAVSEAEVTDPPALRRWVAQVGELAPEAKAIVRVSANHPESVLTRVAALEAELGADLDDLGPPLTGAEVMETLGVGDGKHIGDALDHLQELRYDLGPLPESQARLHLLDWWAGQVR